MPNIGGWEIAIVVVLILIIFGPKKLPELGQSLGRSIRGFRKGLKDNKDEIASTVAQVREATGVDEIKATVAEVREAAGVNEVKAAVSEIRQAANVKSVLAAKGDSAAATPAIAVDAAAVAATAEVIEAVDDAPKTDAAQEADAGN